MIQTRHRIPEAPLHAGQVLVYQVPIPEPLRFLEPRETETRRMHALAEYGLMHVKLYEDIARHGHIATTYAYPVKVERALCDGPVADAEIRQSEDGQLPGAAAVRRRPREAHLCDPAVHRRWCRSISRIIRSSATASTRPARCAAPTIPISTRSSPTTRAGGCSSAPTPIIARRASAAGHRGSESAAPHKERAHG